MWKVLLLPTELPVSSVPRTVSVTCPWPAFEMATPRQSVGSGR